MEIKHEDIINSIEKKSIKERHKWEHLFIIKHKFGESVYKYLRSFGDFLEVKKQKTLRIEIYQSPWKKNAWCIRTGDIAGSIECSNITKEELFTEIKGRITEIYDASLGADE